MTREPDFDEEMDRLQDFMPGWAGRNFDRLRQPEAVWVRVPAGIVLTGGGVLGFLPVLGFWMLPIGLALLAYDVRPMQPPLARLLRFANRKIGERKERKAGEKGE